MKKSLSRRFLSILLSLTAILSLFPPVEAEAAAPGDPSLILPQITLTPLFVENNGKKVYIEEQTSTKKSFVYSVTLSDDNRVVLGSFAGARIKAEVIDGTKSEKDADYHPSGYQYYLLKTVNTKPPEEPHMRYFIDLGMDPAASDRVWQENFTIEAPDDFSKEQLVYYALYVYDAAGNFVTRTVSSITLSFAHEKKSAISWERIGMEVRAVNGVPIGQYEYLNGEY